MLRLKVIIAIFLFFQISGSFANSESFKTTVSLCSSDGNIARLNLNKIVMEENILGEFIADSILSSVKGSYRISLSPTLSKLINSSGFHKGLSYCYGDSRIKKDIFFWSLIASDISGKAAFIATGGLLKKGLSKLTVKLANFSKKAYFSLMATVGGMLGYYVYDETNQLNHKQLMDNPSFRETYESYENGTIDESEIGNELAKKKIEELKQSRANLEEIERILNQL